MWMVKEQSQAHPNGIPCSPVMETQSGAATIRDLLQKQHDENRPEGGEIKHYFVAQVISRRGKEPR